MTAEKVLLDSKWSVKDTAFENTANDMRKFAKELLDWVAQNVDGCYYINGEGRWEHPDGVGTISSTELLNKFESEI